MLQFSNRSFHLSRWIVAAPNTLNRFANFGKKAHWSRGGRIPGRLHSSFTRPSLRVNDMGTKHKSSSIATSSVQATNGNHSALPPTQILPPKKKATSRPINPTAAAIKPTRHPNRRGKVDTNPDHNVDIADGQGALRASTDAEEHEEASEIKSTNGPPAWSKTDEWQQNC